MVGVFKMVTEKDIPKYLENIANTISKLSQGINSEKEQPVKKDVVLFFSFDVVNSTAYKTVNYFGWAQVLNILFKGLRDEVYEAINGAEIWRVLGDEEIFIVKIRNEDELQVYVDKIFKIMISTIDKLKKGEYFKFEEDFNLMKLQNILSLKTSAWIAAVNNIGNIDGRKIHLEEIDNIFERYQSQEGYEIFEFLGNDIDAGFRISKQTQEGRMVLSYELAYLVSQKTERLSYLHIITYRHLKGIWKEKLYPIIWYHNPKTYLEYYQKEITFEDSFAFDAYGESDLIKEYYDNKNPQTRNREIRDDKMYTDLYYALNKILRDRGLESKIEQLQKLIRDAIHDQTKYIDMEKMQVHCVAVCFKIDNARNIKILIAKRHASRSKMSGKWEFGCAKAVINKSIADRIKEEYHEDFGIDVTPILDETREIKEPIPIALYQVNHSASAVSTDKMDKGIITLAQINEDYNPDNFQPTSKHETVQWVTEADLENIEEKLIDFVPDFKRTLEEAFKKIKEINNIS